MTIGIRDWRVGGIGLALCLATAPALLLSCSATDNRGSAAREDELEDEFVWPMRPDEKEIRARERRIMDELAGIAHASHPAGHWAHQWAGAYYVGDGLGMNVNIFVAPQSGIAYSWYGCLGFYDGGHGEIVEAFDLDGDGIADGLEIRWELEVESEFDFISDRLYFVHWPGRDGGVGRKYLVPESQMLDMVNHYNQGGYARDGLYSAPLKYDHMGDGPSWAKDPVDGAPMLPQPWAGMLRIEALEATVTNVSPVTTAHVTGSVGVTRAHVTLDKGKSDGLYVGLVIWVNSGTEESGTLTIESLDDTTAEALFVAYTDFGYRATPPGVGKTVLVFAGTSADMDEW